MSRILRRPMFRGGRVDSRGTGITTGLMDGGRVGFYRGGGTSYLPQQQTGSQILGRNIGNKDFSRSGITGFSFGDLFKTVPITSQGYGEFDPMKKSKERQGIEEVAYDEFDFVEPMYIDGKMNSRYVEENPSNKNQRYVSTDPKNISVNESLTASVEEGLPTSKVEEEPSTEPEGQVRTPKVNEPDTEVTMTDLERALGLDDARKEYVGDALAAASKAFFEGKGMGAISDAAAVKSKAPDIKRLAGLEQFKADTRQKMYETKLGKQFAPGNFEKTDIYLKRRYPKLTERQRFKIQQKEPESFGKQYIELAKDTGFKNDEVFKDSAILFYQDDYKGDVNVQEVVTDKETKTTTLPKGVYTDAKNKMVFVVDENKKIISSKNY